MIINGTWQYQITINKDSICIDRSKMGSYDDIAIHKKDLPLVIKALQELQERAMNFELYRNDSYENEYFKVGELYPVATVADCEGEYRVICKDTDGGWLNKQELRDHFTRVDFEIKEPEQTPCEEGFTAHYSGDQSESFWNVINSLPDSVRDTAYTLGVILQNIESDILKKIKIHIDSDRKPPKPEPGQVWKIKGGNHTLIRFPKHWVNEMGEQSTSILNDCGILRDYEFTGKTIDLSVLEVGDEDAH